MWKDSYLVGIELIDEQHKGLFAAVGDLMESLKKIPDKEEYKKHLLASLDFLKTYCAQHFKDEEHYHKELGTDKDGKHKKTHEQLFVDVTDFESELAQNNFEPPIVNKFLGFLLAWLVYHVAEDDQVLKTQSGGTLPAPEAPVATCTVHDFALQTKRVLRTMTGLDEEDMSLEIKNSLSIREGAAFKVGLTGNSDKKGIGIIYSDDMVLGILESMTGIEIKKITEITYSALQKVSNIISSRIAEVIVDSGASCDVQYPVKTSIKNIPQDSDCFKVSSNIGYMEVVVY